MAIVGLGDRLFSASRDMSIKVWDLTQKNIKPIHTITGHEVSVGREWRVVTLRL
jgi:WD40 repeat protein